MAIKIEAASRLAATKQNVDLQKLKSLGIEITGTAWEETGLVHIDGDCTIIKRDSKLPLAFGTVTGSFRCANNELTTLEGSPSKVGGSFDCSKNRLTTLKGGPTDVGGGFYCSYNKLTTLEGSPPKVGQAFVCSNNKLTTLEGSPPKVGGDFYCGGNPKLKDAVEPAGIKGKFLR